MGRISHPVNLEKLVEVFNLKNFVESGTGDGTSMKIAVDLNLFENLYGIDLDEDLYNNAVSMFESRVKMYNGYSKDEMLKIVSELSDKPTLFWLDAHFPGADYKGARYDAEKDDSKRIPLEAELKVIIENRDITNDVFIMDDLRIYVDRPFFAGSWEFRTTAGAENCDFIETLIGKTHLLVEHYQDQGYMLGFPLSTSEETIRSTIKHNY
jgi:hypothetical protein